MSESLKIIFGATQNFLNKIEISIKVYRHTMPVNLVTLARICFLVGLKFYNLLHQLLQAESTMEYELIHRLKSIFHTLANPRNCLNYRNIFRAGRGTIPVTRSFHVVGNRWPLPVSRACGRYLNRGVWEKGKSTCYVQCKKKGEADVLEIGSNVEEAARRKSGVLALTVQGGEERRTKVVFLFQPLPVGLGIKTEAMRLRPE
jgi:hypothetical protein